MWTRFILQQTICVILLSLPQVHADEIRLTPTRDTWLSAVGDEAKGANGGAPRLKLKSIQELSLIDFDFSTLRDKKVRSCRLFLKRASDVPLDRITVSTLGADWVEGNGTNYAIVDGQSTFTHQKYPDQRWADSDITAVSLGAGSTVWQSLKPEALPDDWYAYDVPIRLVEPCIAGLSPGWLIMDDTGSTWKRDGESFEHQLFPNRFAFSRDSNRNSAPYLLIDYEAGMTEPKLLSMRSLEFVPSVANAIDPRPHLRWRLEETAAISDIVGFQLFANGKAVEQYLMPSMSKQVDGWFAMPVDPLMPPWNTHSKHSIQLKGIDRSGNAIASAQIEVPPFEVPAFESPLTIASLVNEAKVQETLEWTQSAQLGNMQLAVVDPLDQLLPVSGKIVPPNRSDYLNENTLWNAKKLAVNLSTCRGGWVGFQLAIKNPGSKLELRCRFPDTPGMRIEAFRYEYLESGSGPIADPLVPIGDLKDLSKGVQLDRSKVTDRLGSWLIEFYMPDGPEPVKEVRGTFDLSSGADNCTMHVHVKVSPRVMPRTLHFLPEMNCYGLPENDMDYYRLGHRHRVVVNRVPYYQNGEVAQGMAPSGALHAWDWSTWDQRFAGLFDGSAFAGLPRGERPIECFYLPMHENWPSTMKDNYNDSYWADEAFPESYRQAWEDSVADFTSHIESKDWHRTRFHVFLNNKVDFKKRGWSRGSSPWLLDEPANFQDYVALQYFGKAFVAGHARSHRKSSVLYRCDISRPQWQRDTLDGMLGYNVVSQSAFDEYRRLVLDRKLRDGQLVMLYGSNNPIGTNNVQSVAWAWDAWCRGADGILPWQTIGNAESWKKPDELALFYPDPLDAKKPPLPSIRLKAYCYAQQDVELLRMHCNAATSKTGDRYQWGSQLVKTLPLKSNARVNARHSEDAPSTDYGNVTPETFERMRRQLHGAVRD